MTRLFSPTVRNRVAGMAGAASRFALANALAKVIMCAPLLVLSGCARPSPDASPDAPHRAGQDARVAITGGTSEIPDWNPVSYNTVGVARPGEKPYCSGALVTRTLVVTAAHCLAQRRGTGQLEILFTRPGFAQARVAVRAWRTFVPFEGSTFPDFDVAWLQLGATAPDGFGPLEIVLDPEALRKGDEIILGGYGKTETWGVLDGVKRSVVTRVDRLESHGGATDLMIYGASRGQSACVGDSGGPAYVHRDGRWWIAGVLGGKDPRVSSVEVCEDGVGFHTALARFKNWIARTSGERLMGADSRREYQLRDTPKAYETFREMCADEALPARTRMTVTRLMQSMRTFDCSKAADTLAHATAIDLHLPEVSPLAPLTDFSPLKMVRNTELETIIVNGNTLEDLRAFSHLPGLRTLNVSSVGLKSLEGAESLTNLVSLTANSNAISSLAPLSGLSALASLAVDDNAIASLDPLRGLVGLVSLTAAGNAISDLSPLAGLPGLRTLFLRDNAITDLAPLAGSASIQRVDVIGNPLASRTCPLENDACIF